MKLRFNEHCDFINGGSWASEEYAEKGYGILKVSNFDKDSISYNELSFLNINSFEKYKKNQLQIHDVVIATVGSHPTLVNSAAGRCISIPKEAEGLLLNQNAVCLKTKDPSLIDQRYLGYVCKSQIFQHFIQQRGKGAANQMRIPISGIKEFEFNFPSILFQRKIASILSAYDDLIENNLKRIKLLEEKAQRTYEEWFVKMRFPGYKDAKFDEVTGLPEGWSRKIVGEFTDILKGKNITKSTISEGKIPVVAGGLNPAYYHNKANTLNPVITISASGANAGFVNLYLENVWASDCSYIDTQMSMYVYFIYSTLKQNQEIITHLQHGAAQPHVYPKDLKKVEIIVPRIIFVEKFEKLAVDIFDSIRNFQKQNLLLKEARDILLPRLMSGMIDVEQLKTETVIV